MQLAGIPIRDQDVLELARSLRDAELDATAEKLERAYDNEVVVLALTIADLERAITDTCRDARCPRYGCGARTPLP